MPISYTNYHVRIDCAQVLPPTAMHMHPQQTRAPLFLVRHRPMWVQQMWLPSYGMDTPVLESCLHSQMTKLTEHANVIRD